MNKTFSIFFIFLCAAFLIYGLTKQINESIKVGERLETAAEDVNKLQETNRNLRTNLADVQKEQYIEFAARDKLNMAKSGETIVMIPEGAINQVLESEKTPPPPIITPNWQKWIQLFLNT